jgi:uncharacterized protein
MQDRTDDQGPAGGTAPSLAGWDIADSAAVAWVPWGEAGARAKVLASADGYLVALVEAEAGYEGTPHEHAHAEVLYVLDGAVRTQGRTLRAGDAYAAAAGSVHTDFAVESAATYLSVFKL